MCAWDFLCLFGVWPHSQQQRGRGAGPTPGRSLLYGILTIPIDWSSLITSAPSRQTGRPLGGRGDGDGDGYIVIDRAGGGGGGARRCKIGGERVGEGYGSNYKQQREYKSREKETPAQEERSEMRCGNTALERALC